MSSAFDTYWFTIEEVGDRVFAAVAKSGTGAGSNAGIVDLGGCTLVFDAMLTPAAGAALRSTAEMITQQEVRYLVLSHRDYDHVLGAQAFSDCVVIATETTDAVTRRRVGGLVTATTAERQEAVAGMARQVDEAEDLALRREREGFLKDLKAVMVEEHAHLAPRYADILFQKEITITGTRRAMLLLEVGAVHTESDVVGWLADERVLFSGDIVQIGNHPAIRCSGPAEWDAAIGKVAALGAQVVVSGHGPVAGGEAVELTRRYFAQVPAMTTEELLPEPFKTWRARDVWRQNLRYVESL